MAVDRAAGRYVGIAAWTDAEALEASGQDAPGLIADLAERLHGSGPSLEVFDLVLAHVVKPVRIGYWGRSARLEVPMQDFTRAVHTFAQTTLAVFERYEGLAATILFVDWSAGVLEASSGTTACTLSGAAQLGSRNCASSSSQTCRQ